MSQGYANMNKELTILRQCLILLLMVSGSLCQTAISEDRVSYEDREQELLECNIDETDLVVQWQDTSNDSVLTIYVYVGESLSLDKRTTGNKYDNFNYTFESGSSFNLVINDVKRNDDGVYLCERILGDFTYYTMSYSFSVEVPVTPVISYGSTIITDSVNLLLGSSSDLTCSAIGAKSVNDLQLMFSFETDENGTTSEVNGEDPSLADYTKTVSYTPDDKTLTSLSCSILGYGEVTEDENDVMHVVGVSVQYVPECSITVSPIDDDCRDIQLDCTCDAVPRESSCAFYQNSCSLGDASNCSLSTLVTFNTASEYYCQATNAVGTGLKSTPVHYGCKSECDPYFFGGDCSLSCDCNLEGSTGCNRADGRCFCLPGYIGDRCEQAPTTSQSATCSPTTEDTGTCACTGLIAGLVVESVIIAMLLGVVGWFIFNITRDLKKGGEGYEVPMQLLARPVNTRWTRILAGRHVEEVNQDESHSVNSNSAYMDPHEMETSADGEPQLLEVPAENVQIVSQLAGSGQLVYSKALLTTSSGNKNAVVKSPSGKAPIDLEKIWSAEMRALQCLPKDVNLVQTLGWCSSIPKMLLFEYINGTNLVTHLTENFSMHEVHQYGNTKRKRFQVPETGTVENLPIYALDVARGLKFLLAKEFIHPGIRACKVLVDLSGKCKIYDFVSVDAAKELTSLLWEESAPYQWMPPEFLFLDTVAPPGDVWSFGVLMWEIYSYGSQPYPGEVRSEVESSLQKEERLAMPKNCPGAIWQLMNRCWDQSVDTRPKIQEIASHLAAMGNDDKEYDVIPKGGIENDQV